MENNIEIKQIFKYDEFLNLRDDWDNLLKKSIYPSFYLTHGWFKIVLEGIKDKYELCILTAWLNNELLGIAPFMKKKSKLYGINVCKLEFVCNVYTPINNFIIKQEANVAFVIDAFLHYLIKNTSKWDILELGKYPVECGSYSKIKDSLRGLNCHQTDNFHFGNWYLNVNGMTADEYVTSRSNMVRNNAPNRIMKRLIRSGEIEQRIVTDVQEINKYFSDYIFVFERSWKPKETSLAFLKKLVIYANKEARLLLGFIYRNNIPIATQIWIIYNSFVYIQKLHYSEEEKRISAGTLLTLNLMKYVLSCNGVKEVDYLRGDEPYKQYWMSDRRERRIITIFNFHTIKGKCFYVLKSKIMPRLKRNTPILKLLVNE